MHPKLLKSFSIFIYFSKIILIFLIILQKVHKKVNNVTKINYEKQNSNENYYLFYTFKLISTFILH
jgi:hypothetical protein